MKVVNGSVYDDRISTLEESIQIKIENVKNETETRFETVEGSIRSQEDNLIMLSEDQEKFKNELAENKNYVQELEENFNQKLKKLTYMIIVIGVLFFIELILSIISIVY